MKATRRPSILSIVAAALISGGVVPTLGCGPGNEVPVRIVHARRSRFVVPIVCTGVLEPAHEMRAAAAGTVAEIFVRSGSRVRTGEALLRISAPELTARATAAREQWLQLKESRAAARAALAAQQQEVAQRRGVVEADARLLEARAISAAASEADKLSLAQSEAQMRATAARLEAIDGGRAGQRPRLEEAARQADVLDASVRALVVRAPGDGVVYGLPDHTGDVVTAGERVAEIADPARVRVRLRIDAPDLPRVAVGQTFSATFEGMPDQEWQGRVDSVSPALRTIEGREVGEAEGEIATAKATPPFDARISAKVVVGERAAALVVARAALQRDGERRYVYIDQARRAVRRDVSVGLIGLADVEILSGLVESDNVVVPTEGRVQDGVRIRTRD